MTAPSPNPTRTILHVFATLHRGGGESRTLGLLEASHRPDHRHLVLTVAGADGSLQKDFEAAGATVLADRMKSPGFVLRFLRLLRQERVDVLHTNIELYGAPLVALAQLAGVPQRIVHLRTDGRSRTEDTAQSGTDRVLGRIARRHATHVLGVAPSTLENLISPEWRQDPRMEVLPNGFDIARYRDAQPAEDLPPAGRSRRIVHVGRDAPMKNRERAIRILANPAAPSDAHLLFVGRNVPESEDRCRALARELGVEDRVHLIGERGDIPSVLRAADVLLQTSTYEGLPGVLLEALAAGTPVVASDLPGTEYIQERTGLVRICPLTAPDTLWVKALDYALAPPAQREAAKAPSQLAGSVFDMHVALARVENLWDEKPLREKGTPLG
ncbi:glycosyltransferase [Micrococcus luteus]|uniref:glycosyltransferase n=1 Tax=Micrococcus luteus TaxID=1270 RepID=UPI003806C9D5